MSNSLTETVVEVHRRRPRPCASAITLRHRVMGCVAEVVFMLSSHMFLGVSSSALPFNFFFYHHRILSTLVCWSHALVNGRTSKRPASDGGRYSGQLLMMWSAVCSGSPHSHVRQSPLLHGYSEPPDPSSQSV